MNRYEKRKIQRKERRIAGVCTRCGVPLTDEEKADGYVQCTRCRKACNLNWYPNSTRGMNARPMQDRGKNGDCWRCGRLLPNGYEKKICPECIEKAKQGHRNKKKGVSKCSGKKSQS